MRIKDGIAEIWVSLDAKTEILDVYQAFKASLAPLLAPSDPIQNATWNPVLDRHELPNPDAARSHLPQIDTKSAETVTTYFAARIPASQEGFAWVSDFTEIEWPNATEWAKQRIPALTFSAVRNVQYEKPYMTLTLSFAIGVLGKRSSVLKAKREVLKKDLEFSGPDAELSHLLTELDARLAPIEKYENENRAAFERITQELTKSCFEVIRKFSRSESFLLREHSDLQSPVDVIPAQPIAPETLDTFTWRFQEDSELEMLQWADRISWDGFQHQRALKYLGQKKQDELFAETLYAACMRKGKACWSGLVKALSCPPISYASKKKIITFLADPNWPGSWEASRVIDSNRTEFKAALLESIEDAKACNDDWWEDNIRALMSPTMDTETDES